MKFLVLLLVTFIVNASANCGCLKCCKHLQGIDIPGPNGCPIKVIFKRPKLCDNNGGCDCGCSYTPVLEAPLMVPRPSPVLRDYNCKIQYCPKPCYQIVEDCGGQQYSAQIQAPLPTQRRPLHLLNNLKYRCNAVLVPPPPCDGDQCCCCDTPPDASTNPTFESLGCCCCCSDRSESDYSLNTFDKNDQESSCSKRNKRSINTQDTLSHSHGIGDHCNDPVKSRSKRDLAKSGYKFLMGMLPQFVRDPLHHSIQGTYVPPKPTLKDKIDELKLKRLTSGLKQNYYDFEEAQPNYLSPKKSKHHWAPNFENHYNQPKYSSGIYRQSKLFGTPKQHSMSYAELSEEEKEPFFNTKYKYGPSLLPKFSLRTKQAGTKFEEATLLRKLKKLNGNHYSTNIEDQANDFMQDLLKPDHKRFKRSAEDLKRQKRTIILSSNEIDLPPQYEVDYVSIEDDELESAFEDLEALEEGPIVGDNSPFSRKLAPSSKRFFPYLPKMPKPEVIMGKNVIKQAVRDELNTYHKKLEQEQKIKEIKTNMERRKQEASIIPHNPIFLLLTAPMKFLKHFHDINKGVNPVMTSLPKLVHTTKKYFRDFGKNFQKNCLNLASDVIGDFDHVPPQVVQRIQPEELRRYRRDSEDARESVRRNDDDVRINIGEKDQQSKDKESIDASIESESAVNVEEKRDSENTHANSFFHLAKDSLDPNITLKGLGSHEGAVQKNATEGDEVSPTRPDSSIRSDYFGSLFEKFVRMFKDLVDLNVSLNSNGSIPHVPEAEKIDHDIVEMHNNSDRPIEINSETFFRDFSTVSGKKSVVGSGEKADSDKDTYSDFSDIEFKKVTSDKKDVEEIKQDKVEYDYKNPLAQHSEESNESHSKAAVEEEVTGSQNIEDSTVSNSEGNAEVDSKDETAPNKIQKELSDPGQDSLDYILGPQYSLAFENSKETQNFRLVPEAHVRKKRYVVKVVDDGELQDQVEEYLTEKMDDQFSYLKPLQDYYEKVNGFLSKMHSGSGDFEATDQDEMDYEDSHPKRRVLRIKKVKPRIIIDNKGLPFMEYDGFKRPLLLKSKYMKHSTVEKDKSSEETGSKIATLIARAKEDSEVVRSDHKDINGEKIIKERISFLLEEIDQLVHLNAEDYDEIFEDLIKIQNIKTSIEQDWKRILIDNRETDINAKIRLLSKFKDLQQTKDISVKNIAKALGKNDNEFVRCQLVNSLIRLQKLQNLITNVAEDFEQHLRTKTSFNTKKEIRFVDYLSELNFVYANTRNDLVNKLCQDRDVEGQKNIEILHKLKKLLATTEGDSEKFQKAAKLVWEMKHMEKMQKQTIQDMNKKLSKKFKIKKELKILFDLQKRFEDCVTELDQLLGNVVNKTAAVKFGHKKDIKDIIAEMKHKHEERLLKIKGKASGLQKFKKKS